ncbi:MAG: hypothetical protein EWM72_00130 [Nitrospira sp.]|nr:MAG: hypothetical protein EWM72_00130 [Nitrospira sp.]
MSSSVWPYDTFQEPAPPTHSKSIDPITCFVASPYEPKSKWDDLFNLVQTVAATVGKGIGVPIQCHRADHITSSGLVHPEIWKAIRSSDLIIVDVSGQNGNVMLELGIAASWKRKEHVIILRDKNDEKSRIFDINPARHLEYETTFSGFQKLANDLGNVLSKAISNIPVHAKPKSPAKLPFQANLVGTDAPELYTEDETHRCLLSDCLEFGAPLNYRYSWMSFGDLKVSNVSVRADLKMTLEIPSSAKLDPFMGIMVRGQSFFANWGHLVFIRKDGKVHLTMPEDGAGKYHDEPIGEVPAYNMYNFTPFEVLIDSKVLRFKIKDHTFEKHLSQLPYVFSSGRIIFIAGYCRVGIRNVVAEEM